jgi:DNA-binding response OmpR family regulator
MPTKPARILVVEDETFLVKIYSVKLKKEGFEVLIATDGEQAVQMANEVKPDIILLDLILPKMNGFEALEKMRANPELKNTPVIVLSNLGQDEDIKRAESLGATDYLVKANFSIQDVIAKVRATLAKQ